MDRRSRDEMKSLMILRAVEFLTEHDPADVVDILGELFVWLLRHLLGAALHELQKTGQTELDSQTAAAGRAEGSGADGGAAEDKQA